MKRVIVLPLLLSIATCGSGGSSDSTTPTPLATQSGAVLASPTSPPVSEETASPDVGSPVAPGATIAASAGPAKPTASATGIADDSDVSAQLPPGITIGTPRSGEPIDKGVPPPVGTGAIPTSPPSSFDVDGDGLLSVPELIEALRATYPTYAWPPDYRLDLDALIADTREQAKKYPMQFQNGYEQVMLGTPYMCAWEYTLRDAIFSGDDATIATSVEKLRAEVATNPSMTEVRDYYEDVINKAELGDPGPLIEQLDEWRCSQTFWVSGTPSAGTPSGEANASQSDDGSLT